MGGLTPLEVGLLGWVLLFFGGSFFSSGGALWGGLVVLAFGGSFLALHPGNLFLLGWTSEVPHASVAPAGGDFKFLVLLLAGAGALPFLLRGTGYEPLLVGTLAVGGGLLTFSTDHLVLLYLALEVQALALYTLVAVGDPDEDRTDSSVRYLLVGSFVSGFMLLSFARGYSLHGGFHLGEWTPVGADPLGSAWILGVLLFKAGTAPFHFWAPLVYTPLQWGTLGLVLGATKVNVWYLLVHHFRGSLQEAWWAAWWAGLLGVVIGSVGGYFQTGVGGLLAYSGVINGGYLVLLGLSPRDGGFGFGYYAGVYLVGTLGVVLVGSVWEGTRLSGFAQWGRPGVVLPLVLYYLVLSLGGLPVFPGFFGKIALLGGLAPLGFALLAGVVVASIVPAVYYVSLAAGSLFGTFPERETSPPAAEVPALLVGWLVVGLNGLVTFLVGLT